MTILSQSKNGADIRVLPLKYSGNLNMSYCEKAPLIEQLNFLLCMEILEGKK